MARATPARSTDMAAEGRRALESRRATLVASGGTDDELASIDAALARISAGTWGVCVSCGGAIGRDRLRAVPDAQRCLSCTRGE